MKLTIIGVTGGIGSRLRTQALAAGHDITAVVRNPTANPRGTRAAVVDLAAPDLDVLGSAIEGSDAVLSALGARTATDTGIVARGTNALVEAMATVGTRRLIVVSAAPIGTVPSPRRPNPPRHDPGDGIIMRNVLSPLTKMIFRAPYADLALMEDGLRDSDLDWTIVRPPRLTDGPRTRTYRTAHDRNVRRGLSISRSDVADLMLALITQPDSIGHTVGIAA
jgi:putative NADH-flavin reductase